MMRKSWMIIAVLFIALSNGGGCNVFNEVAIKNTDVAIIDDVNNLVDAGLWNDAILKWGTLSADAKSKRANILLIATCYAGRGGLDLINLATNISASSSSGTPSKTFFKLL